MACRLARALAAALAAGGLAAVPASAALPPGFGDPGPKPPKAPACGFPVPQWCAATAASSPLVQIEAPEFAYLGDVVTAVAGGTWLGRSTGPGNTWSFSVPGQALSHCSDGRGIPGSTPQFSCAFIYQGTGSTYHYDAASGRWLAVGSSGPLAGWTKVGITSQWTTGSFETDQAWMAVSRQTRPAPDPQGDLRVTIDSAKVAAGTFDVVVHVRNAGPTAMTGVRLGPLRFGSQGFRVLGGPAPAVPGSLAPGQSATTAFRAAAAKPGTGSAYVTGTATAAGTALTATGGASITAGARPFTDAEIRMVATGGWIAGAEAVRTQLDRLDRETSRLAARAAGRPRPTARQQALARAYGMPDDAFAASPRRASRTLEQRMTAAAWEGSLSGAAKGTAKLTAPARTALRNAKATLDESGPEGLALAASQRMLSTYRSARSAVDAYSRYAHDLMFDPATRSNAAAAAMRFRDSIGPRAKAAVDGGVKLMRSYLDGRRDLGIAYARDPVGTTRRVAEKRAEISVVVGGEVLPLIYGGAAVESVVFAREALAARRASALPAALTEFNAERSIARMATLSVEGDAGLAVGGIPRKTQSAIETGLKGVEADFKRAHGLDLRVKLQARPTQLEGAARIEKGTSVAKGEWCKGKTAKPTFVAVNDKLAPSDVGQFVVAAPDKARAAAALAAARGTPAAAGLKKASGQIEATWDAWMGRAPKRADFRSRAAYDDARDYYESVRDLRRATKPGGATYEFGIGTGKTKVHLELDQQVAANGKITPRIRELKVGSDVLVRGGREVRTGARLPTIGTDIDIHALELKLADGSKLASNYVGQAHLMVTSMLRKIPQWGRHGITMSAIDVTAADAAKLRLLHGLAHGPTDLTPGVRASLASRLKVPLAELERLLGSDGLVVDITSTGTTAGPGPLP